MRPVGSGSLFSVFRFTVPYEVVARAIQKAISLYVFLKRFFQNLYTVFIGQLAFPSGAFGLSKQIFSAFPDEQKACCCNKYNPRTIHEIKIHL